jgi:rubrerythrin
MNNKTQMGLNRTGIALSPRMGPEMVAAAERYGTSDGDGHGGRSGDGGRAGDGQRIAALRGLYAAQAAPFGTMPPPGSLKEAAVTALDALKGNKALVYMDKLGARLAFERSGARLYEALLPRVERGPTWEGGPTVREVLHIHTDELQHFQMLVQCVEELGGDPTVQTPSADVSATASLGVVQVLGDPRVSLRHALDGILIAELVDTESWSMLIDLATSLGHAKHARSFQAAFEAEERHLSKVRGWLKSAMLAEANMDLTQLPGGVREAYEQIPLP